MNQYVSTVNTRKEEAATMNQYVHIEAIEA